LSAAYKDFAYFAGTFSGYDCYDYCHIRVSYGIERRNGIRRERGRGSNIKWMQF